MEQVGIRQEATFNPLLSIIVCSLGALFYFYEYILQVSPGVMTDQLMRDFQIDSAGLGAMSAYYFYAYGLMQIPAGLLYDKFGPRRLITLAVLICAVGAYFFATTHSVFMGSVGRLFMGFGSAFSFIGILLLISRWFPARYFAVLAGTAQLMSSLGAIVAEEPLAYAVISLGWRKSMIELSIMGSILALFVWLIVRDSPNIERDTLTERHKHTESHTH